MASRLLPPGAIALRFVIPGFQTQQLLPWRPSCPGPVTMRASPTATPRPRPPRSSAIVAAAFPVRHTGGCRATHCAPPLSLPLALCATPTALTAVLPSPPHSRGGRVAAAPDSSSGRPVGRAAGSFHPSLPRPPRVAAFPDRAPTDPAGGFPHSVLLPFSCCPPLRPRPFFVSPLALSSPRRDGPPHHFPWILLGLASHQPPAPRARRPPFALPPRPPSALTAAHAATAVGWAAAAAAVAAAAAFASASRLTRARW